ncbi:uncharacterized protein LOC103570339 [Microplitis demolitor]|uniref:uncharacterized protein LOC103570339 n=1 Tax=Microplitis demolitor TaxID=69319 RepID=UPI00235B5C67|nr:uncharacterized protein LOC103570339 [Microplitis demolitor]
MIVGGLLFGTIADQGGRKNSIPISMVTIFLALLGFSFSQTYFLINFFVFMLGVGTAGSNTTIRVYLIECVPAKKRGSSLVIIDILWIIGYGLSLGLSWILIPSIINILGNEFRPNSWRVLVGLASASCLIMAYASSLLPYSPRYLLYRRRPQEALIILQQMFSINNSQHVNNFPSCNLNNCVRPDDNDIYTKYFFEILKQFLLKTWKRLSLIYSLKFIKYTLLFNIIRLSLFPSLIWITQWATYLSYEKIYASSSNKTCSINVGNIALHILSDCHEINNTHFEYSLIFLSSCILGEVLLFFSIDTIGRQISLVVSGLIGGISILVMIYGSHQDTKIIWLMIVLASFSIIYTTTNIELLENYPTSVRGTVWGFTLIFPQLTIFFINSFATISCWIIIYVILGSLIGAVVATLPIADLTNSSMKE